MMRFVSIVGLTVGVWGQRLAGAFIIGPLVQRHPLLARAASLVPAAVVMAVIVQMTFADGRALVLDERAVGVAVAAVAVWRRLPFVVVVVGAAAVTAALRAM